MNLNLLKAHLRDLHPDFWSELRSGIAAAQDLEEFIRLAAMRRKALARGVPLPADLPAPQPLRLALLGACTFHPLQDILELLLADAGFAPEWFLGEFHNETSEILEPESPLYRFEPGYVVLIPGTDGFRHDGSWTDPREAVESAARERAQGWLQLAQQIHLRCGAEVLLANLPLPARRDPGAFRSRTAASDWTFRKLVNLELGAAAPSAVHLCDLEFLSARLGTHRAEDPRGWHESKQPGSPALLVELARELGALLQRLRGTPRKVLVLDLDNTLWGGVVAEDGPDQIELGDTSPRGEAFKAFQRAILSLKQRGVLLAVCSKNDESVVRDVLAHHPEMVLRPADFAAIRANWLPKSDNLRQIAAELSLGLDSFVFVDDSPAEIDVVRRFTPGVATLLLGPDPSEHAAALLDAGWFDPLVVTAEDLARTGHYQAEASRRAAQGTAADMPAYLRSLEMTAEMDSIGPSNLPRVTQLINKSNQFNLTTRRRTEAEVAALMGRPDCVTLAVRLRDRFGDHGLISVVIGWIEGEALRIDTWLMSCRVLKRQVEEAVLNELARLALERGCTRLEGTYIPTAKNGMVAGVYPGLGFAPVGSASGNATFRLPLNDFAPRPTAIALTQPAHGPS